MTQHGNVTPNTQVSTNFYGSVTGIVDKAYIEAHGGGGGGISSNEVEKIASQVAGSASVTNLGAVSAAKDYTDKAISANDPTFSNAVMAVTQDFKTNTYTKTETDALIAANKPEYEDLASNVVWRIEADGARFFFKPVRPVNTEDLQ